MAKSPSPWSVKGVDPEAREAAKIAARKAGMTVGAWLSQIIRQSATEQLRGGAANRQQRAPEPPPPPRGFQNVPPPGYGQAAYEGYGPAYAGPPQQNHAPGAAPPPAPTIQAVFESIQRLSSRIEQSERRTAETIAPIAEKVSELSRKIEDAKSADGISTAPVERAMQKIAERLDRIEHRDTPMEERAYEPSHDSEPRGFFGLFRRGR